MDKPTVTALEIARVLGIDLRSVRRRAAREGWTAAGNGKGGNYAFESLPEDVCRAIAEERRQRAIQATQAKNLAKHSEELETRWKAWERSSDKRRHKAQLRVLLLSRIADRVQSGSSLNQAIDDVRRTDGAPARSRSTLLDWWGRCKGFERNQWPVLLMDDRKQKEASARGHEEALAWIRNDYLRAERPTVAECVRRCRDRAAEHRPDWLPLPSLRTVQRHIDSIPADVRTLAREGEKKAERIGRQVKRSVAHMQVMDEWNADGHRVDVNVTLPGGKVGRPHLLAVQDVASGMIVGHHVATSENSESIRLSFVNAIQMFGIPRRIRLDNGRAYASNAISGGASNRSRWKRARDDEEEIKGIFARLGAEASFVTPYRGQAKPIERAFADLRDRITADDRCRGCCTGNNPLDKPHNYGSGSVPWDVFLDVVADAIQRHNAEPGRVGRDCRGRSFEQTFEELYTQITKVFVPREKLRLILLPSKPAKVSASSRVKLHGNEYFSPELSRLQGSRVILHFDPESLHAGVHVYRVSGEYVCRTEPPMVVGFNDASQAESVARLHKDERKRKRAVLREYTEVAPELPPPRSRSLLDPENVPPRKAAAVQPIDFARRRKARSSDNNDRPAEVIAHPARRPAR
jgi:hypothetical protein